MTDAEKLALIDTLIQDSYDYDYDEAEMRAVNHAIGHIIEFREFREFRTEAHDAE